MPGSPENLNEANNNSNHKENKNLNISKIKSGVKSLNKSTNEENQNLLKQNKRKEKTLNENITTSKNYLNSIYLKNEEKSDVQIQYNFDKNFYVKLVIALGGVLTISINTIYGFLFPHGNVGCMEDLLFENTKTVNDFFAANTQYRDFLLITASLCIDVSLIYILFIWVTHGKSYRFLVALLIFYALRSSVQVNFIIDKIH